MMRIEEKNKYQKKIEEFREQVRRDALINCDMA